MIKKESPSLRADLELFRQGRHCRLFDWLGSRPVTEQGRRGVAFSVWAPGARSVSVVGDFNGWQPDASPLERLNRHGVWYAFVEGVEAGTLYKYRIVSSQDGRVLEKADPFAYKQETPPATASVVWDLTHQWNDAEWLARRGRGGAPDAPMSTYEMHLGSWKRGKHEGGSEFPRYWKIADELVDYVSRLGFTHVELMPPLEHPFYGSWGYQTTGYFAATSRYGSPQDLMTLIDKLHQAGIGVILDWVPSHFPADDHGLAFFDGTPLFEYPDPRLGYQPDWKSYVFNYGRNEVQSFLISSALFWLEHYHIDAIRVDAVASMLYLDYSRAEGQWVRNKFGGRENLEAIDFLRKLNSEIHQRYPDVRTIAEESTAWPKVSHPIKQGGLGFDMKWDMGWMHDTLDYFTLDPIARKHNHNKVTFRVLYAFSENFVLPLSHDEVVHGKGSLLAKMFGDRWQKFASLRALYGYMYGQPGKKLLFMGDEIGQRREWSHERALDWPLLDQPDHAGVQRWVGDLNRLYRDQTALHQRDFDGRGFEWVDCGDADQSVLCFLRRGHDDEDLILVVCNLTPVPRHNYRVGVPRRGPWVELLNSDAETYGGSGLGNLGQVESTAMRYHRQPHSVLLTLPPLATLFLAPGKAAPELPGAVG